MTKESTVGANKVSIGFHFSNKPLIRFYIYSPNWIMDSKLGNINVD